VIQQSGSIKIYEKFGQAVLEQQVLKSIHFGTVHFRGLKDETSHIFVTHHTNFMIHWLFP
jgi:hypothetical protein